MLPQYKPGTKVVVLTFMKITINNVVVLKDPRDGRLILKKVIKCKSELSEGSGSKIKYFVLGDNPNESTDSRDFGWVKKEDVIGRAVMKL